MDDQITVPAAARALGLSEARVRALLGRGLLNGVKDPNTGRWTVFSDSVAARLNSPTLVKPLSASTVWERARGDGKRTKGFLDKRFAARMQDYSAEDLCRVLCRRGKLAGTFSVVYGDAVTNFHGVHVYRTEARPAVTTCYMTFETFSGLRESVSLMPAANGSIRIRIITEDVDDFLGSEGVPFLIHVADLLESPVISDHDEGVKLLSRRFPQTEQGVSNENDEPFRIVIAPPLSDALWAKTDLRGGSDEWGLLITHLSDAGHVARLLWRRWTPDSTKNVLARVVGSVELAEKIAVFAAAVHDAGKASPAFSSQSGKRIPDLLRTGLPLDGMGGEAPHTLVGGLAVLRAFLGGGNEHTVRDGSLVHALAATTWAHHGRFPARMVPHTAMREPSRRAGYGYTLRGEATRWVDAQDCLVLAARRAAGFTDTEWEAIKGMPAPAELTTVLSGFVVMCDWIASNQDYFPLGLVPPRPDRSRAEIAFKQLDFGANRWAPKRIGAGDVDEVFSRRFAFATAVRPLQHALVKHVEALPDTPGLVILEAPTGQGKTEAALLAAETLAQRHGCSGVFVALPTRATSDAMYRRVSTWLRGQNAALTAHLTHGKSEFNEEYNSAFDRLKTTTPIYDVDGAQHPTHETDTCCRELEEWFRGGSQVFLSDFTVGTIDQLLLSAAASKHYAMRHLALSGKVVIIDEVHASDMFMSAYLSRALRWLGRIGVPVIALTATLTPTTRRVLHSAYSGSSDEYLPRYVPRKRELTFSQAGFPDAEDVTAYPVITSSHPTATSLEVSTVEPPASRTVDVEQTDLMKPEDVAEHMLRVVGDQGCAALIFNTVARAQSAYRVLREAAHDDVLMLHSRFTAQDRGERERRLLDMVGPRGTRPKRLIVISTQVLEQSLDADFDVMYSDIAPLDLVVQRAGRLHRHRDRNDRNPHHLRPVLHMGGYVRHPDREPTLCTEFTPWVYDALPLLRTVELLARSGEIVEPDGLPDMMRQLDKGLTDPQPWHDTRSPAYVTFGKGIAEDQASSSMNLVSYPTDGGNVPWNTAEHPWHTPVRRGVENLEVVVAFRDGDTLRLARDRGPGEFIDVSKVYDRTRARQIALRAVPLNPALSRALRRVSQQTDEEPGRSKRDRKVPSPIRGGDATAYWDRYPSLRYLGVVVLDPDDENFTSGSGEVTVPAYRGYRGENFPQRTYCVSYSPETGLQISSA